MPADVRVPLVAQVWAYAEETGQEARDVYVKLLTLINVDRPEVVDAALAELRAAGTR